MTLLQELNQLTEHHKQNCPKYAKLLSLFYPEFKEAHSLEEIPYLPVTLFKFAELLSISKENIFKVLESSGTTQQHLSRIYLDAETAKRQTEALFSIMTPLLGPKRLPLLIIDAENGITNRKQYSARGAALIGMMTFGRDVTYALNEDMSLNKEAIENFLKRHEKEPKLLFGMTFIVWKYFLMEILSLNIEKGILVHSGGWKRMEQITNQKFKETVFQKTKISSCHNFYGMVEQVGTVFLECKEGHFHTPPFGDVIIRDPITWQPAKEGVIEVLSAIPRSYPGHALLTEDLGVLTNTDRCPCGQKGKTFLVTGRVPQSELRGCSDTFAL